jgi:hypothetical protein
MDKIKQLFRILRNQTPQAYALFAIFPFCWQRMADKDWDLILATFSITREIGILHALPYILGCALVTFVTMATAGLILHLKYKQPAASIA